MQAGDAPRTSVLLVDDQPADLVALERHLRPFALHLVKAGSGEEALHRLELERETPDVERLRGHMEVARGQVRRMTSLVDSLLDATRITRGRLPLRLEQDVNLAAIVRDVAAGFEIQAVRAGCAVELETPGCVPGQWDVLRLEQVVANLLSNALKFGAGGPVRVRVEEREGWARLTVRDEGIGMDEEVRARIFGRFERGVSERHYGGLGLGLFITHEVVEALGGHIHVESAPGRGATFTVELPCSSPGEDGGGARHDA